MFHSRDSKFEHETKYWIGEMKNHLRKRTMESEKYLKKQCHHKRRLLFERFGIKKSNTEMAPFQVNQINIKFSHTMI